MKTTIKLLLALAIAMGIGRFIFTPALSLMINQTIMTPVTGSFIASANYIGYFLGTIVFVFNPKLIGNMIYKLSLILTFISLLIMILFENNTLWIITRLISGFCSAIIFIYVAEMIFVKIREVNPGITYSGVGFGIMLTGIISLYISNWKNIWIISSIISIIIIIYIWNLNLQRKVKDNNNPDRNKTNNNKLKSILLIISYFFEGFGYIIITTYVVVLIKEINPSIAQIIWIIVGLSAIPSTIIWSYLSRYINITFLIIFAYILQLLSGILPILSHNTIYLIISSIFFGGTFMGIR